MQMHLNYMATSAERNLKSYADVFMNSKNLVDYNPRAFWSKKKNSLLYETGFLMETFPILA